MFGVSIFGGQSTAGNWTGEALSCSGGNGVLISLRSGEYALGVCALSCSSSPGSESDIEHSGRSEKPVAPSEND